MAVTASLGAVLRNEPCSTKVLALILVRRGELTLVPSNFVKLPPIKIEPLSV